MSASLISGNRDDGSGLLQVDSLYFNPDLVYGNGYDTGPVSFRNGTFRINPTSIQLDLKDMPTGYYMLELSGKSYHQVIRIMKE